MRTQARHLGSPPPFWSRASSVGDRVAHKTDRVSAVVANLDSLLLRQGEIALAFRKLVLLKRGIQNVPMLSVLGKLAYSLGVNQVSASENREADSKNDGDDKFLPGDAGLGIE